jgi:hypothetical protein
MRNDMTGLKCWQENKRTIMFQKIDEAILYLEKHQLPINRKSIAKEIGVSRQTMSAEYINAHLLESKHFNKELNKEENHVEDIKKLKYENEMLRNEKKAKRSKQYSSRTE